MQRSQEYAKDCNSLLSRLTVPSFKIYFSCDPAKISPDDAHIKASTTVASGIGATSNFFRKYQVCGLAEGIACR
jgi:hypothetical protein